MKHVTVLAVFQFTRGKNGASWPRSASRALELLPFRAVLPGSRPRPIFFASPERTLA